MGTRGDLHAHGMWGAACRQGWADGASQGWQGRMKTWATPRRGQGAMEGFGFSQPPQEPDGRGASPLPPAPVKRKVRGRDGGGWKEEVRFGGGNPERESGRLGDSRAVGGEVMGRGQHGRSSHTLCTANTSDQGIQLLENDTRAHTWVTHAHRYTHGPTCFLASPAFEGTLFSVPLPSPHRAPSNPLPGARSGFSVTEPGSDGLSAP